MEKLHLQSAAAVAAMTSKTKAKTQKELHAAMSRLVISFKMSSGYGPTDSATKARGPDNLL